MVIDFFATVDCLLHSDWRPISLYNPGYLEMVSVQTAQSSQTFIRSLKAPSDPPQPDGPTKIEIARDAWNNESFYVPNKGEVTVDWLLSKLLKDKEKELYVLH